MLWKETLVEVDWLTSFVYKYNKCNCESKQSSVALIVSKPAEIVVFERQFSERVN